MQNFTKDMKAVKCSNAVAAGQTLVNSAIVDMAGFDGVCFQADLGIVTSGAVMVLQAQDSATNNASAMANLGSNMSVTDVAQATTNGLLQLDFVNVQKRYVRLQFTPSTQNVALNSIVAFLYRCKEKPITADPSVAGTSFQNATS